jgi:hypothetical protein
MRQPPASTTALRSTNVQSKLTDAAVKSQALAVTVWVIERRATTRENPLVCDLT